MANDASISEQDGHTVKSCASIPPFVRGALLLQEKWVLLIVYSLTGGPVGFSDLMRRGNVNTTTLTQRLNLLEKTGIITKTVLSTMPPRTSYDLTDKGRALQPVLDAITEWSAVHLAGDVPCSELSRDCSE